MRVSPAWASPHSIRPTLHRVASDGTRPWWLQVRGLPPGMARRRDAEEAAVRERWPDWDSVDAKTRRKLSRTLGYERLARNPARVRTVLVVLTASSANPPGLCPYGVWRTTPSRTPFAAYSGGKSLLRLLAASPRSRSATRDAGRLTAPEAVLRPEAKARRACAERPPR